MTSPVVPPIDPMLAKPAGSTLPPDPRGGADPEQAFIFEPKWDGFRCLVFKDGDSLTLQSRNLKPFERYVPELLPILAKQLPDRCVLDGELVVVTDGGLDFEALQQRIHPAESRVNRLADETPTSYIAFDLLALGDRDLMGEPFRERRRLLEGVLGSARPPIHLTPATTDRELAMEWFRRFEGAGLDGLIAKPPGGRYEPGKRAQLKVKHKRTADCVVAGYRMYKDGKGVGSLLLGAYDDEGNLHHLGVATSFSAKRRVELLDDVTPYRLGADELDRHPWAQWHQAEAHGSGARMPGSPSRWNAQKDLSFEALRIERVVEVAYEGLLSGRFRHSARFERWRPDRTPESCTYDQFEIPEPLTLDDVFAG